MPKVKNIQNLKAGCTVDRSREIQRMLPRHFKIMELCASGYTPKDIAQATGVTKQTVGNITNSPLFQDELARFKDSQRDVDTEKEMRAESDALEILRQNSTRAALRTVELMESDNEKIALSSASEILDRVTKSGTARAQIILDSEAINTLFTALRETREAQNRKADAIEV
jgi:DNA-directed RNA polymerase